MGTHDLSAHAWYYTNIAFSTEFCFAGTCECLLISQTLKKSLLH